MQGAEARSKDVEALRVAAESGDAGAQFLLAAAHDADRGTPASAPEALRWYRIAADNGHAEAQNSLGSALQAEDRFHEAHAW